MSKGESQYVDNGTDHFNPDLWVWGADDSKPRFLHTMIRVKDLDTSLRFYTEGLGMKRLGEPFDIPARRVTAVFVGFDDYSDGGCVELVNNWDRSGDYSHGNGYGHISIGVPDMEAMVAKLEAMGAEFTLRPAPLLSGGPQVAFLKDPDGYAIELVHIRRHHPG